MRFPLGLAFRVGFSGLDGVVLSDIFTGEADFAGDGLAMPVGFTGEAGLALAAPTAGGGLGMGFISGFTTGTAAIAADFGVMLI